VAGLRLLLVQRNWEARAHQGIKLYPDGLNYHSILMHSNFKYEQV